MKCIGLTGGIATGKSTVAIMLRERGLPVVDADQVARDVVAVGTPALQALRERFGPEVVQADGSLDRRWLRRRITASAEDRKSVEAITHPAIGAAVIQTLTDLRDAGHALAFVEAALMVETGSYQRYDALWVVTCAPETQLGRLMSRDDQDEASSRAMIAMQLPMADKVAVADVVLVNDGDVQQLRVQVDAAVSRAL